MKSKKNIQDVLTGIIVLLAISICIASCMFVSMMYEDLKANNFIPIPSSHVSTNQVANLPTPEPIPPSDSIGALSPEPIAAPNEGGVDLRLTDEGCVNVSSEVVVVQYSDNVYGSTYELSIPFEKSSLDDKTIGTTGLTPMMELIFSKFNPQVSLQENVDDYLVEAFIFYEIQYPPSSQL